MLVLYTPSAMSRLGVTTDAQMETQVADAFASTNAAMVNSEISLLMNVVHVEPVSFRKRTAAFRGGER